MANETHDVSSDLIRFRGGIRGYPSGSGATWPFGHLEFDTNTLTIRGAGKYLHTDREHVRAIRVGKGRVSVIDAQSRTLEVYFAALNPKRVSRKLAARGWPVENDKRFRRRHSSDNHD